MWGIAIGLAGAVFVYNDDVLIPAIVASAATPIVAWAIVLIAMREPKRYMQLIRCPNCCKRCEAVVEKTLPFHTYIHECEHCDYVITESEWEPIR